jgi:large subunit ribosomal protein L4e
MELPLITPDAKQAGKVALPAQFGEPFRPDLIKRAVEACQANARQPFGADPMAGKRMSVRLSRRRRKYKGAYGKGISRMPRKTMSRNGANMQWVGAFAPGTVGGRRAHPAKAETNYEQLINKKERRKAIRSALAATLQPAIVRQRGHQVPAHYPFALDGAFEKLGKTKDVRKALLALGLEAELGRASRRSIRPGKGKSRGRPYRTATGPLLVVAGPCALAKAARTLPGVDVATVNTLNAELLAPGTHPGRLTLFTKAALERLAKEALYA